MPRGASRWRDVSNGPDWTDLTAALKALGDLNEASASLIMRPNAGLLATYLEVTLTVQKTDVASEGGIKRLIMMSTWPNKKNTTLEQTILFLIYDLDRVVMREWYVQQQF